MLVTGRGAEQEQVRGRRTATTITYSERNDYSDVVRGVQ